MIRYKIEVNRDACVGDGLCCEAAPATFERDHDEVKVFVADPMGDPPENILAAAKRCRLEAITLRDAWTGERIWPRR